MNLEQLDTDLQNIDATFHRINWGGCGCMAAMLADALRLKFPVMRITSSGNCGDKDLDEMRSNMEGDSNMYKSTWSDNGLWFNHVWIEVLTHEGWRAIDSEGVHMIDDMYQKWGTPATGSFTIDEINALSMNSGSGWNSSFDRDQLPEMQAMITETIH